MTGVCHTMKTWKLPGYRQRDGPLPVELEDIAIQTTTFKCLTDFLRRNLEHLSQLYLDMKLNLGLH